MALSQEARQLLLDISEQYIQYRSANGTLAYHIQSGKTMPREAFIGFTSKHFGTINMGTEDKEVKVSAGEIWWNFHHDHKREVRDIVMEPTAMPEDLDPNGPEIFNRWYVLKQGMEPANMLATPDHLEIFLNHLMFLSDGDSEVVFYFMNWLAWLYQNPAAKIPVAILFYSKKSRMGKSMLYNILSKVFARELVGTGTGKQLQKSFDDAIEHKRLVIINEMARTEKADSYESFKNTVSEPYVQFEGKHRASKEIKNIAHFIITTNNEDALPLMEGDGRIAVFRCLADRLPNSYYKTLAEWMEGRGAADLAGVLARWKFPADWDAMGPAPQTEAARTMQHASRSSLTTLVGDMIESRTMPFDKDCGTVLEVATKLETMYGTIERKINISTVRSALEESGALYLGSHGYRKPDGAPTTFKPWAWRDQDKWNGGSGPEIANECGIQTFKGVE